MANKFAKNEEAVSAVVAVILLVAITVILAAVAGGFVFNTASNVQKTYVAAFTASRTTDNHVCVINEGGNDINKLASVSVTIDGTPQTLHTLTTSVGSQEVFPTAASTSRDIHVIVVGTFIDQSNQILLDTYV